MRDILAALLRDRGYTHDENDSDDYWYGPTLGVRPLMVCVQWELDRARVQARVDGPCPAAYQTWPCIRWGQHDEHKSSIGHLWTMQGTTDA